MWGCVLYICPAPIQPLFRVLSSFVRGHEVSRLVSFQREFLLQQALRDNRLTKHKWERRWRESCVIAGQIVCLPRYEKWSLFLQEGLLSPLPGCEYRLDIQEREGK